MEAETCSNISVIKDIIIAFAAVVTTCLAFYGVTSWKREISGKVKYDSARNLLLATYKLRDAIFDARDPLISASEFTESDAHSEAPSSRYNAHIDVFHNRWKPIWVSLIEYDAATLEAEAVFGVNVKHISSRFRDCVETLWKSTEFYLDIMAGNTDPRDEKVVIENRNEVFATRNSEDDISTKIKKAISLMEVYLKPILKR